MVGINTIKQIIAVKQAEVEALETFLVMREKEVAEAENGADEPKKAVKGAKQKVEKAEKKADVDTSAFEAMTNKELIAIADANGVSVARAGKNKKYYIDRLVKAGITPDSAMNEPEEEEAESVDYKSMKAKELFDLCKERGLECKPRQKADVYIALLEEDDKSVEEDDDDWGEDEAEETDDEADEWGEEDEEEEEEEVKKPAKKAPAKSNKKVAGKTAKKTTSKKEVVEESEEEEDDDDWNI